MQRMDGPIIEEVVDHDARQEKRNRRINRIKDLMARPETKESKELLKKMLDLLQEHLNDLEDEQLNEGANHRDAIATLRHKIDIFTPLYNAAVADYMARKEESRREEARRAMSFGSSQNNITGRDNRSKLHQSSQRTYSSEDEENDEEYAGRNRQDARRYHHQSPEPQASSSARRDHTRRVENSSNNPRMRAGKSRVTKTNSRRWRPGQKALSEIRKYQKSTDMLIQKAPFHRVVQEILCETSGFTNAHRIRADAISALQEAAEAFLVEMFEGAMLLSNHAKRVTLMASDIQLYRRLCLRKF